jgi:hypothetical protein
MPTKARFGRIARSAPSLTATIVALAQEYQRIRESNIVDAWKNGGEFEGKPVHDKDILKWMKDRRDELTPGDPKWDYYNNQVLEYTFAIENSKAELDYKRGDKSDSQMAAFYHTWANKLPRDSEAYREREKLAAGYQDRANSSGRAAGRAASDARYAKTIQADYGKEAAYDTVLFWLEDEAHNRGILDKGENLSSGIDPLTADGARINALWDEIATSPEYAADRAHYSREIARLGGKGFNGDFSQTAFNGYTRDKKGGVDHRIQTAKAGGRKGDITAFTKDKDGIRAVSIVTGGFDETEAYEDAHDEWLATFLDPNATPGEVDRANQKYIGSLNQIKHGLKSNLKPGEHDDRLGLIENEIGTMKGDKHPVQHWGGSYGAGGNEGGKAAAETGAWIEFNNKKIEDLGKRDASGKPLFVMVKVDRDSVQQPGDGGIPVPTTPKNHNGAKWGIASVDDLDPDTIFVPQNDGGQPVVTAIIPSPIRVLTPQVTNASTGETTDKASEAPIGYAYTNPDGTVTYKYQDAADNWLYTPHNPFGGKNADGSNAEATLEPNGGDGFVIRGSGNGYNAPPKSSYTIPDFYSPGANKAMTDSVVKSGYSSWLLGSDPKKGAAYAQTPDAIIASLALESGGNPVVLAEKVADADNNRAVYLGNSSAEKNRVRSNALNGIPNPVLVRGDLTGRGAGAEARTVAGVTRGGRDEIVESIREENLTARGGGQMATGPTALSSEVTRNEPDAWLRKTQMVLPPPKPGGEAKTAPTSLGPTIPTSIATSLLDHLGMITGAGAIGRPNVPKTGPIIPSATPPPAATPPKPTTPKPVSPPSPLRTPGHPTGAGNKPKAAPRRTAPIAHGQTDWTRY